MTFNQEKYCVVIWLFVIFSAVAVPQVFATDPQPITADKPIEIKGQSHGASLLNLGGERFQIKFIRIRKDYTEEILNTPY